RDHGAARDQPHLERRPRHGSWRQHHRGREEGDAPRRAVPGGVLRVNTRPADALADAANAGAGARAKRAAASVPALDGFRGLAVLWIVLGHCWWQVGGPALDGGVGRNLFSIAYTGIDVLFIRSEERRVGQGC